jgi:hypothetical protein
MEFAMIHSHFQRLLKAEISTKRMSKTDGIRLEARRRMCAAIRTRMLQVMFVVFTICTVQGQAKANIKISTYMREVGLTYMRSVDREFKSIADGQDYAQYTDILDGIERQIEVHFNELPRDHLDKESFNAYTENINQESIDRSFHAYLILTRAYSESAAMAIRSMGYPITDDAKAAFDEATKRYPSCKGLVGAALDTGILLSGSVRAACDGKDKAPKDK